MGLAPGGIVWKVGVGLAPGGIVWKVWKEEGLCRVAEGRWVGYQGKVGRERLVQELEAGRWLPAVGGTIFDSLEMQR